MERRAFLGTLLASLGVLAIDPKQLLWQPSPSGPMLLDGACVSMEHITNRLLFELSRFVSGSVVSAQRIGDQGLVGQVHVGMEVPENVDRYGLDVERYIEPAAHALAFRLKHARARTFAAPPLPIAYDQQASWIVSREAGMALRGIRMNLGPGADWREALRFDVLYGT